MPRFRRMAAILVGLYTVEGGLASVVWTDMIQCLMLVGGAIFLFFIALSKVPGGSAMMHANPERFHLYHPPSDPIAPFPALVFLALGLGPFYQGTNQVMVQRILGARSTPTRRPKERERLRFGFGSPRYLTPVQLTLPVTDVTCRHCRGRTGVIPLETQSSMLLWQGSRLARKVGYTGLINLFRKRCETAPRT